jgi:hypothetical protein
MSTIPVEQAVYHRPDGEAPQFLGRSPGFLDAWLPDAERWVHGFGTRPEGFACPSAVFAQPLGRKHVGVVQVSDTLGNHDAPRLGFRILVIARDAYDGLLDGDPFALAERLPAAWDDDKMELPSLSLPVEPPPPRTVAEVQRILQRTRAPLPEDADLDPEEVVVAQAESPALLGGVQVLVDGGKVYFRRQRPDTELMRDLWTLLPTSTRRELWPASFAFSNRLGFDAVILPFRDDEHLAYYNDEDQAADYPEGRYERGLQVAAEAGDQSELDALFGRRSANETWWLGVKLLVIVSVAVLGIHWFAPAPGPPERRPLTREERAQRAAGVAGIVAVGDPYTAWGLLEAGYKTWGGRPAEETARDPAR